jgi:hypothetical protein
VSGRSLEFERVAKVARSARWLIDERQPLFDTEQRYCRWSTNLLQRLSLRALPCSPAIAAAADPVVVEGQWHARYESWNGDLVWMYHRDSILTLVVGN